jgi:protein-S-isoprenylcysteine O-methyltransferase Ste14
MFVLVRALTYAALFIGFVLVYLPGRFLSWSGIVEPATTGAPQVAGMIIVAIGTAIALWCVFTFVFIGKGTPAPFDPPRKLVIRGPYRFVRNPMYIGAGMTIAGAAFFYESPSILIYTGLFFLITHLFVVLYEEPTLRRTFGDEYEAYFRRSDAGCRREARIMKDDIQKRKTPNPQHPTPNDTAPRSATTTTTIRVHSWLEYAKRILWS